MSREKIISNLPLDLDSVALFSYRIYQYRSPDLMRMNPAYTSRLLALEKQVRGKYETAHIGGDYPPQLFRRVSGFEAIEHSFRSAVAQIARVQVVQVYCSRSWAFMARRNEFILFDDESYHRIELPSTLLGIHNHAPFHFSGVYYVRSPGPSPQSLAEKDQGRLVIYNPIATGFDQPDYTSIEPEPGLLIIFPSCMSHRVVPPVVDGDRISISMDALVFDERMRATGCLRHRKTEASSLGTGPEI